MAERKKKSPFNIPEKAKGLQLQHRIYEAFLSYVVFLIWKGRKLRTEATNLCHTANLSYNS